MSAFARAHYVHVVVLNAWWHEGDDGGVCPRSHVAHGMEILEPARVLSLQSRRLGLSFLTLPS